LSFSISSSKIKRFLVRPEAIACGALAEQT